MSNILARKRTIYIYIFFSCNYLIFDYKPKMLTMRVGIIVRLRPESITNEIIPSPLYSSLSLGVSLNLFLTASAKFE